MSRVAKTRITVASAVALVALLIAAVGLWHGSPTGELQKAAQGQEAGQSSEPMIEVGGVLRPASDVAPPPALSEAPAESPALVAGRAKPVDAELNANTRSIKEAYVNRNHPERISILVEPAPFNKATFEADPQAYMDVIEPGRVFQPAQPGENVTPLKYLSDPRPGVALGGTIDLQVQVLPSAPVTFSSLDLGSFQNMLTSITVRANEQGVATVNFTASEGTVGDVNILCASPLTSGQGKFVVHVLLPDEPGGP